MREPAEAHAHAIHSSHCLTLEGCFSKGLGMLISSLGRLQIHSLLVVQLLPVLLLQIVLHGHLRVRVGNVADLFIELGIVAGQDAGSIAGLSWAGVLAPRTRELHAPVRVIAGPYPGGVVIACVEGRPSLVNLCLPL